MSALITGGHAATFTARQFTPSIPAGAFEDVTVTFRHPLPDANYTAVASVEEAGAGDTLRLVKVVSVTPTGCTVRVHNPSGVAQTGTVHVIIVRD